MQRLKRILLAAAGWSGALSIGVAACGMAVKKFLHIKSYKVNFAGQKPGVCIIGGSLDGPTAVFVSTKYRPGCCKRAALLLGAMAVVLAGCAGLIQFVFGKEGDSH